MGAFFDVSNNEDVRSSSNYTPPSTAQGTVTGWFRLDSSGTRRAFGMDNLWECRTNGGTGMLHEFYQSGTSLSFTMTLNTIYHFAFTWQSSVTTKEFFVDGVLNGSQGSAGFGSIGTGPVAIGTRETSGQEWDGYIDDIRVYNRRLTANEIATIYACRGSDCIYDGLVNRWQMNEGAEGTTVGSFVDSIAGFNLTIVSGTPTYLYNAGLCYGRKAA